MIELYYLDVSKMTEERYNLILKTLSSYRAKKAEAYLSEEDRRLSAGAGYLLQTALKGRGICESEAKYTLGKWGKPQIEGVNFNLSHSKKIAVCALSDGEVGVDVERLIPYNPALINRVCTPREREIIKSDVQLTRLWTAKESYIKYLGTGFSVAPTKLEIDFATPLHMKREGAAVEAVFSEFDLDGYRLTVCADEACPPPVRIDFEE